jgi:ubiquinone/menaquinone biosynthesis C-methylase UbiE
MTYINYGCGPNAPKEWINFDASPTLRIQKIHVLGKLLEKKLNVIFPKYVKYGDITKGLPVETNSCTLVYCAHILEHLSLEDCRKALVNTYKIIKHGGKFRCVLPDLESAAKTYMEDLERKDYEGSLRFMQSTLLGKKTRSKNLKALVSSFWGNSNHFWMWDHYSLSEELKKVGFKEIRRCQIGDSEDQMLSFVEEESRYVKAVAIECVK